MTDSNDGATVPAWFAALRGQWRLRRCVLVGTGTAAPDDGRAPADSAIDVTLKVDARLRGVVRLFPAESGQALHYEEAGVLRLRHGAVLQSKRRYLYRCDVDAAQQTLAIDFADGPSSGLPFVKLPWPALSERDATHGDDVHLCGADHYRVRYRFETTRCTQTRFDNARANKACHTPNVMPSTPGMEAVAWDLIKQQGDAARNDEDDVALPKWHRIVQRTRVRGPKKDYAIVSILDRIDTGSVSASGMATDEDVHTG